MVGVEWFTLIGPVDSLCCEWCRRFVDTRFTLEILRKHVGSFGRDPSIQPVEYYLGGCHPDGEDSECRHSISPLFDEDLDDYPIGPK
jgi:hypothetical protein